MRRHTLFAVGLALFAGLAVAPAQGTEPTATLEDTLDWLRGRLPQLVTYTFEGQEYSRSTDVTVDGCKMTVVDWINTKERDIKYTSTFSLGDLDVAHHEVDDMGEAWILTVPTSFGKRSVRIVRTEGKKTETLRGAHVNFPFQAKEMATRASKALSHASRLCGGRREPF
jgi:hypothetical protein